MKRINLFIGVLMFGLSLMFSNLIMAQTTNQQKEKSQNNIKTQAQKPTIDPSKIQHSYRFVDKNGDGYNDNAPDHDSDGIPNGVDPDYKGAKVGSGKRFTDMNGDGINDNRGTGKRASGKKGRGGYGRGSKSGTANQFVQPQKGTRAGSKTGACNGIGPKGKSNRGGN